MSVSCSPEIKGSEIPILVEMNNVPGVHISVQLHAETILTTYAKERIHMISFYKIGESLTSKSIHESSTKPVVSRCNWYILGGNEGRIVVHLFDTILLNNLSVSGICRGNNNSKNTLKEHVFIRNFLKE